MWPVTDAWVSTDMRGSWMFLLRQRPQPCLHGGVERDSTRKRPTTECPPRDQLGLFTQRLPTVFTASTHFCFTASKLLRRLFCFTWTVSVGFGWGCGEGATLAGGSRWLYTKKWTTNLKSDAGFSKTFIQTLLTYTRRRFVVVENDGVVGGEAPKSKYP